MRDEEPRPRGGALAASAGPVRLGFVDGLRALAALYVAVGHIGDEIWPGRAPAGPLGFLVTSLAYGRFAVSVFIVLSGFSLMLPVARNGNRLPWGAWGFYRRRARRILPPYYLAMGLSLLLIWLLIGQKTGTHWDISLPVTWSGFIAHVLLYQDFTLHNYATINYTFWSIAVECQIYLLFPALIVLFRRYVRLFAALLIAVLSLLLLFALTFTWVGRLPDYTGTEFAPQLIGLFAIGIFAASVHTSPTPRWARLRAIGLWDALALGCFVVVIARSAAWPLYQLDLVIGAGAVGLLLAASRPGRLNPIRAALEWRPLVWIGGFSYSIYLIHAPLIQVIWQYWLHPLRLSDTLTHLGLLLLGLPLIVAASWGFWYVCERPFLSSRRTAPASAQLSARRSVQTGVRAGTETR